jgi:hypothetical protein
MEKSITIQAIIRQPIPNLSAGFAYFQAKFNPYFIMKESDRTKFRNQGSRHRLIE